MLLCHLLFLLLVSTRCGGCFILFDDSVVRGVLGFHYFLLLSRSCNQEPARRKSMHSLYRSITKFLQRSLTRHFPNANFETCLLYTSDAADE